MTRDASHLLFDLRPAPDLDGWDVEAALACVLAEAATPPRQPRLARRDGRSRRSRARWVAAAGVATAAAVAVPSLLPAGSPGGPTRSAAATLEQLAVVAGAAGSSVGPGQYAYVEQSSVETADALPPIAGERRSDGLDHSTSRVWTAPDGDIYLYRALGRPTACLAHDTYAPNPPDVYDYENLDADALAALPTDPAALATYVASHPSGGNRGAVNAFLVAGDLVRSDLAPPLLRAAAIRMLARTPGVTVDQTAHDAEDRVAVRVDLRYAYGVQSLFFDPRTSSLLEEQDVQSVRGSFVYRSVISASGVVSSVPDLARCPAPPPPS